MQNEGLTNDYMAQLGGENTFEQCVSEMALAGFQGREVGGKYPTNPQRLKKAMELRGLKIASQFFLSYLCEKPYEEKEREFVYLCFDTGHFTFASEDTVAACKE